MIIHFIRRRLVPRMHHKICWRLWYWWLFRCCMWTIKAMFEFALSNMANIYNRHLPTSLTVSRQHSTPTARARIWGLQADPQTLAEAHAQLKRPCKTSASKAVRRLVLMGRAESEDCHSVSVTLRCTPTERQSSSIHNSLSLDLTKSGLETFVFFLRQILRTPRFCLRTKSLRSLCKISSPKSQKTPVCNAPTPQGRMIVFATLICKGTALLLSREIPIRIT